jgi:predicted nucleic-acid-binding Zn-ribbon protein
VFLLPLLGSIECVSASIVLAGVQLIALAKIECTWFVQIRVLWCNYFDFYSVDAKLLSYKIFWCDYVKWNTNVQHQFLNELECMFACFVCMFKRVWECTLHLLLKLNVIFAQALEFKKLANSYDIKHQYRSKLVNHLGYNLLVRSVTLSLVVSS